MKKKLSLKSILFFMCLIILLSGCSSPSSGGTKSSSAVHENITEDGAERVDYQQDFDSYYRFPFTRDDERLYFFNGFGFSDKLMYTDLETGITAPLCGKPECTHEDASCNASVGVMDEDMYYPIGLEY